MAGASSYEALPQEGEETHTAVISRNKDEDGFGPTSMVKPETYYGEGPFDPPSSDDEDEDLMEKDEHSHLRPRDVGRDLEEDGRLVVGKPHRPISLRLLVISLVSLLLAAALIGIFAAFSYTGTPLRVHGTRRITMDHVFNGTFFANRQSVLWVPEAGDGVFATSHAGRIELVDLKTNTTRHLASFTDFTDERGHLLNSVDWKLSSDMRLMLVKTDYVKQWRHSSFGNYYVYDLETKTTFPLAAPANPPVISYAKWAPVGQSIAYVANNDLYIVENPSPDASPIRVTTSGNASLFHGVPDWVYEEEVLSSDYALWWSPDASKVAFLRFDETAVDEFTFPVYNPTEDAASVIPYPDHISMKYPKPGYNNPLVSVHIFEVDQYQDAIVYGYYPADAVDAATLELDWQGKQSANNSIIQEIVWIANTTLLLKEVNRAGDNGTVVLFDLNSEEKHLGQVVRKLGKEGEEGDSGWIDASQNVYPIPASLSPDGLPSYLDIVPTSSGYNHVALFSPANSSVPHFLTSGEWEVTGKILVVDVNRSLVYFQAANPSSTQRHIYSVPLPRLKAETVELTALTDPSSPAYYDADFSPEGGFYLLSYRGPQVPWQRLVRTDDGEFDYILTENTALNDTLKQFDMPVIVRSTIESDGYELNTIELRPPRMDTSGRTKYPVLFRVYGGPGSQMVSYAFGLDWHFFVTSTLQYIIVTVDGRGTGYRGRALRNPVKDNLGYWETVDQINAARIWAAKNYVDPDRIGIWGWSYGGFMSSKVAEVDAGIHSLAMAVAPVSSWRLYDSIYTERYMNLPAVNPDGYVTASISNVSGFANIEYLLAHGSGDDNVHFANSAHLLDMFTKAKIRNFSFRMFTDSDHSINRRGANRELYEFMTTFLVEKWGKGAKRRG